MLIYSVITNKNSRYLFRSFYKEIAVLMRLPTFKDTFFVRLYIVKKH